MLICGIKLTHDAAIAIIRDGVLVTCVEIEKIANNPRYSKLGDLDIIESILANEGMTPDDVDRFVIDGWHEGSGAFPVIHTNSGGAPLAVRVAGYNERNATADVLQRLDMPSGLKICGKEYAYSSYLHVASHVLCAYASSPWSSRAEPAHVLVWDGGQYPRMYYINPDNKVPIRNLGYLFGFHGSIYGIMGHYFGPYKRTEAQLLQEASNKTLGGYYGGLSIAGKLMSYIALGRLLPDLLQRLPLLYEETFEFSAYFEHKFCRAIKQIVSASGCSDADVLLTIHTFIEQLLVSALCVLTQRSAEPCRNLCFVGGSALNIKWNSAIRRDAGFEHLWVPPFPNDSGSAFGAALCEQVSSSCRWDVKWSVFRGPKLEQSEPPAGWSARPYSLRQLAQWLADSGDAVVFLSGRAELGPRALGSRSILAAAKDEHMKEHLNAIKKREQFRPVAPICLEEFAEEVFDPGCRDPYMLFNHDVREHWKARVPAICHLDGSARLQTVSPDENPVIHELLRHYHELTGLPLLCNTSANLNGSGFFPDARSAMEWGGCKRVYCDGMLYEHE